MGTNVIYNGITIQNCLTRQFHEDAVYDDSRTDLLHHKFTISVVGQVHNTNAPAGVTMPTDITPRNANAGTATHEARVRRQLMHPRAAFQMYVGGVPILEAQHATSASDALPVSITDDVNNGPKPLYCHVNKIIGAKVMEVEFGIEVCIVDCAELSNKKGVLSNRWSMADDYDQDFYCTRTIEGTLRIAHVNLNPHAFRDFVFPPLQLGFHRDKISITSSPDGLAMRYTITDRQMYAAAPAPATAWSGTLTMLTNDGINVISNLTISMTGSPGSNKLDMLNNALAIARSRIFKRIGADSVLQSASIVDHLESNVIETTWQFANAIGSQALEGFALNDLRIGQPIDAQDIQGYDRFEHRIPKYFGETTPVGLFVSYLQSPCNDDHAVQQDIAAVSAHVPRGTKKPEVETSVGTVKYDEDITKNYSESHRVHIYTFYQIDSSYPVNPLTVQLPIAKTAGGVTTPDTCAFIQLAPGVTQRVIKIAAERLGDWPELPQPAPLITHGSLKMRLLRYTPEPKAPKLEADGKTKRYSIDAVYVYGLNRMPNANEQLPVGIIPWMTGITAVYQLPSSQSGGKVV